MINFAITLTFLAMFLVTVISFKISGEAVHELIRAIIRRA